MEQHHYFLNNEHDKKDYFTFEDYFLEEKYIFNSCADIFSKNCIDYGTRFLLKTIVSNLQLNGTVLDVGCGYGVIGIVLKKNYKNIDVSMIDINENAVKLTKQNIKENNVIANAFVSNLYNNVNFMVNHIVTNPPIKAGKNNLFNLVKDAKNILYENGDITLVIKKKHGMESLKNYMFKVYNNVEVLKKDKGYYILHSIKTE